MRTSAAFLVAVAVVVTALPAAAQPIPPTPCPTQPPGITVRAGYTCTPLAGAGVNTQTTCTLYGDTAWLISQLSGFIPPGTCTFTADFGTTDWVLCETWDGPPGEVVQGYIAQPPGQYPTFEFFQCNVPVAGVPGLAVMGVLVLALGAFVLWRRVA